MNPGRQAHELRDSTPAQDYTLRKFPKPVERSESFERNGQGDQEDQGIPKSESPRRRISVVVGVHGRSPSKDDDSLSATSVRIWLNDRQGSDVGLALCHPRLLDRQPVRPPGRALHVAAGEWLRFRIRSTSKGLETPVQCLSFRFISRFGVQCRQRWPGATKLDCHVSVFCRQNCP